MKVLIIDNNAGILKSITCFLQLFGYEVVQAGITLTVEEALSKIRGHPEVDAILLDGHLQIWGEGVEIAKQLDPGTLKKVLGTSSSSLVRKEFLKLGIEHIPGPDAEAIKECLEALEGKRECSC